MMTGTRPLKVLLVAPHLDAEDVGESLTAFHLVKELSKRADLTVLALECTVRSARLDSSFTR